MFKVYLVLLLLVV